MRAPSFRSDGCYLLAVAAVLLLFLLIVDMHPPVTGGTTTIGTSDDDRCDDLVGNLQACLDRNGVADWKQDRCVKCPGTAYEVSVFGGRMIAGEAAELDAASSSSSSCADQEARYCTGIGECERRNDCTAGRACSTEWGAMVKTCRVGEEGGCRYSAGDCSGGVAGASLRSSLCGITALLPTFVVLVAGLVE